MRLRARWLALTGCLLLGAAICLAQGMDDESDLADVTVEGEDGEEVMETFDPGKFTLNLVDDTSDPGQLVEKFVPTKEWQTVKKGQPLPKGLHYRMNMATGKTEAKLLDDADDNSDQKQTVGQATASLVTTDAKVQDSDTSGTEDSARLRRMEKVMAQAKQELDEKEAHKADYWKHGDKEGMLKLKKTFSREQLKNALKKFKIRDDDVKYVEAVTRHAESQPPSFLRYQQYQQHMDWLSRNEAATAKSKFRSMKDIKQQFDELHVKMRTDTEVLQELLTKYRDEQLTEGGRVAVLTELEYHLHQIDNAVNFADMGGLALVIQDLNSSSLSIRRDAAFVIGSASQSNPHVQVKVVKLGGVHKLIRMLSTESSVAVRSRVLYALSCTLRHFPFAQKTFIDNGGVHMLTFVLDQTASAKLRLKAMTLAVDLLEEQKMVELHTQIAKGEEFEKLQQYKNVSLQRALLEQGWCALVPALLEDPDHDAREKVLTAMTLLASTCPPEHFRRVTGTLARLRGEYGKLTEQEVAEEGKEGYFGGVLKLVDDLLKTIKASEKPQSPKVEL